MTAETTFEHVVVGGGPMGAAAARHLAAGGARVLLLAPRDPATSGPGDALPSSHADLSRVTRRLDSHPVWARLADRSIARYRRLEADSGIRFFTESGCLTVIEDSGRRGEEQVAALQRVASELGTSYDDRLVGAELERAVPALNAEPGATAFHELNAGWLNPLSYVRALVAAGRRHGLEVVPETMAEVDFGDNEGEVITRSGRRIRGERILFAMGPFSAFDLPVPDTTDLVVFARTVVHVRLSEAQVRELDGLPSMIVRGVTDEKNCYILPPARYPDGHWYIKIGGGARSQQISSGAELSDWFAGPGDPALGSALRARLDELLPATRGGATTTQPCAITVTNSTLPRIVRLGERSGLVTGGNGHAAKSGDEIGRLAAGMALGRDDWDSSYPVGAFTE